MACEKIFREFKFILLFAFKVGARKVYQHWPFIWSQYICVKPLKNLPHMRTLWGSQSFVWLCQRTWVVVIRYFRRLKSSPAELAGLPSILICHRTPPSLCLLGPEFWVWSLCVAGWLVRHPLFLQTPPAVDSFPGHLETGSKQDSKCGRNGL